MTNEDFKFLSELLISQNLKVFSFMHADVNTTGSVTYFCEGIKSQTQLVYLQLGFYGSQPPEDEFIRIVDAITSRKTLKFLGFDLFRFENTKKAFWGYRVINYSTFLFLKNSN